MARRDSIRASGTTGSGIPDEVTADEPISQAACKPCRVTYRALFVFDQDNWCYVFADADDAAGQLETNDVDAGEYVAFDQDGTVYELWTQGLYVRLRPADERDVADLRQRLRRFLVQRHIECASCDLADIGNAILEAEWEDRWPKRPRWLASRLHGDGPPRL
jgi:hypothetical protein